MDSHHEHKIQALVSHLLLLPPATKLGQGYVFTRVCDSVHRGVSAPVHAGIHTYNILRITIVYVFEQHEYLISCHLIWAVSPLLALVRSRRFIKNLSIYLLHCLSLEYLMVSEVQRTYVSGSKGLFELLDNFNNPHGGIQNTMQ